MQQTQTFPPREAYAAGIRDMAQVITVAKSPEFTVAANQMARVIALGAEQAGYIAQDDIDPILAEAKAAAATQSGPEIATGLAAFLNRIADVIVFGTKKSPEKPLGSEKDAARIAIALRTIAVTLGQLPENHPAGTPFVNAATDLEVEASDLGLLDPDAADRLAYVCEDQGVRYPAFLNQLAHMIEMAATQVKVA